MGLSRRRVLLVLGAAQLVAGCSHQPATTARLLPSPTPAFPIPEVARPTPGVCPSAGAGSPQHHLACSGTDIALTVDDGPDPTYTPKVLSLLAKYKIQATFCMIGKRAAASPGLVAAVVDGGHHIANHTYTHPLDLQMQPQPKVHAEIARAGDAIERAGGGRPTLFRSPGGNWSSTVLAECQAQGVRPLDWSVDPRDWSRPGVEHIVTTILTKTHPGAIILEHDGGGNRQQTVDALGIALPRLIDAGYRFVQP